MGSTSTSMSTCCDNLNYASATVASNDIKQVRVPDDCIAAALTDSPSPCKKRWKRNCRIMGRSHCWFAQNSRYRSRNSPIAGSGRKKLENIL
ncbi:hypothetical protein D5086_006360 [Populus alba]|uniref:Uncharacterized protein n=1 Tax=Populus alba TaxID=43335 RepID=A0ACC4CKG3_POPAL